VHGHARILLADNPRTSTKAAIKRASASSRKEASSLVGRNLDELEAIYSQGAAAIEQEILATAAPDGNVKVESLQGLLSSANHQIQEIGKARDELLDAGLQASAQLGVDSFAAVPEIAVAGAAAANEAVNFVQTFVAEDGLQLSERLWRLDVGAQQAVGQAVQSAIIQGHSASQAAQEFIRRGAAVPDEIAAGMRASNAVSLSRAAADALMTGEGNPYDNALRVFRTEMNRAYGEAYRAAGFGHPDVIGMRFVLSPNHPRPDICDMHAKANLYGLGPGVYPPGKSPWPAHPNTISYEEVVFADEVSEEDRAGQEDRIEWLKKQPAYVQEDVLGSKAKRAALEQDLLKESEISTPWRVLKQKYTKKGVDVEALSGAGGDG
jgi:hypothetical protein